MPHRSKYCGIWGFSVSQLQCWHIPPTRLPHKTSCSKPSHNSFSHVLFCYFLLQNFSIITLLRNLHCFACGPLPIYDLRCRHHAWAVVVVSWQQGWWGHSPLKRRRRMNRRMRRRTILSRLFRVTVMGSLFLSFIMSWYGLGLSRPVDSCIVAGVWLLSYNIRVV